MAGKSRTEDRRQQARPRLARLVPTQQRSRERFERILECAAEIMAEKGSEAFRMSDIVERTGVAFGSLYQYFPDKTAIIGTLAERYNAVGRDCVRRDLAVVRNVRDLHPALCRIVDSYYQMFIDEPVMRDIWQATQADRALQKLDEEDGAYLAGLLDEALRRIAPNAPSTCAGVVFATDHDADRGRPCAMRSRWSRRKPRACSLCSSGCCRRICRRWRSREAVETYCSNTAAHAGLRLPFCRRRQAVMARALGISPAQRR